MKASDSKIKSFIGNSSTVFIIPPFQRNYSWDEEQCCELFDDIKNSINKGRSHYIGNIVYYVGENDSASFSEYILIDGQQRITSILLLLCALRRKLSDENAKKLEKKFLINEDEEDEKYRVKLKQTANDLMVFEKIIDYSSLSAEEQQNKLFQNYNYFLERLSDYSEEEALKFYNAVGNLDIVDLNLQIENDLEAVQKIFEKINSTGKPLSVADLIRNYLLISKVTKEQEKLYKNYWVEIEKLYQDKNNISDFAKHYLITKRRTWVEEKKMYSMFKLYFDNSIMSKEAVLKEMLRYSKFYNWFVDEKCPDEKANICLKELNVLKSDDMYSLLLILFDKLYDFEKEKLRNILDLLCDFMIRYRIVSPVNGSADIRKTLFTILSKIMNEEISLSRDSILYELSNSPSPGGRFPDDDEFENSLEKYVNTSYAKALLYKLEYKLVKNIEVDIRKVTVEHLMPQTLSNEWKSYLGGEKKALLIHNTYLNNIGNLALLSRPMNSENSNSIWDKKKKNINESQFTLTNSIDKTIKWDEDAISSRCEYITTIAINNITAPLKRDRGFEVVDVSEEYKAGLYNVKDANFSVTGRTVKSITYENTPYSVRGWFELVAKACQIVYELDSNKFNEIVSQNRIHKSTFTRSYYLGKDPIICKDKKYLVSGYLLELGGTTYYVECSLSANMALRYFIELLKNYDLVENFKIEIE